MRHGLSWPLVACAPPQLAFVAMLIGAKQNFVEMS